MAFLTEIQKNHSKNPHGIRKRPQIPKEVSRRMENAEHIKITDFKSYCKAIKRILYWHKNKHINQYNRIQSLAISPYIYYQRIFDKGANNTQRRRLVSSINSVRKTTNSHAKEWNKTPIFTTHKSNFKWIKDFNGRPESIKLLELNLEKTLLENGFGNVIFKMWHQKHKQ